MLLKEELLWKQKSTSGMAQKRRSQYKILSHKYLVRKRGNKIEMLQDGSGRWVKVKEKLKDMAVEYYSTLFRSEPMEGGEFITGAYPIIKEGTPEELGKELTMEETKRALWEIGSYKAPGPNDYQAIFFKATWSLIGQAIPSFIKGILEGGEVPQEAAEVLFVLIPKELKPNIVKRFRPLSLCNTTYKLVSNVIVNILKEAMRGLISPYKASFMPGR